MMFGMTEEKQPRNWRRFGRVATALAVGAFAAYASYDHMRALALATGQPPSIAALLPISVDGLIVFATYSMDGMNRFWPRLSFWLGVGATISANVLAARHDLLSQVVSAWAPVSLLCVIETWSRRNKTERWRRPKLGKQTAEVPAVNTSATSVGASEPSPNAISTDEVKPRTRNSRGEATAKKVAKVVQKNPDAPVAKVAAIVGVSESTARRYVPPVAAPTPEPATVSA